MGYLANKKHQAHINTFLKIVIIFSAIITFASFGKNIFLQAFNEYRWQILLLLSLIFIYTLFRRFYLYMIFSFLLLSINFFAVSSVTDFYNQQQPSSTKILFVSKVTDTSHLFDVISQQMPDIIAVSKVDAPYFSAQEAIPEQYNFLHSPDMSGGFMLSRTDAIFSGRINLGTKVFASFVKIQTDSSPTTFVAVDFYHLNILQIEQALNALSSFVAEQDDPVVVFGNFNTVAWSRPLSKFISKHNLVVKNGLCDNVRNIFIPQKHYILAYEKSKISGKIMLPYLNSFSLFTRF